MQIIGMAIYDLCLIDKLSLFENIELKITVKYFDKIYIKFFD